MILNTKHVNFHICPASNIFGQMNMSILINWSMYTANCRVYVALETNIIL